MQIPLPGPGKAPLTPVFFPTRHQAFIFRASEFVGFDRIADILSTTEENVRRCAAEMGIDHGGNADLWLKKGYVSVIRSMWHILPYSQLTRILGINEDKLAVTLREEDFLDIKLDKKPVCEPVTYRALTEDEKRRTKLIYDAVKSCSENGAAPFDFKYEAPDITFGGRELIDTRMIYLFSGLYQTPFDVDSETYCPDSILESYQKLGINGIWTQGILFQLTPFPFDPSMSAGWEKRLENLRKFTERLDRYSIKLYLYLNEPRPMPPEFFEKYPHLKGATHRQTKVSLCTSTPQVKEYLTDAVERVTRAAPLLGGYFTITRAENQTNCYSHADPASCGCPRCSKRSVGEVIGEVVDCIRRGVDRVDPDKKVFAWSWNWQQFSDEIIDALPDRVILMSQSERDVPTDIGGIKNHVEDYSLGQIGPGELACREWERAKARGLETAAKLQINTTWEASTVPAVPVRQLVEKHVRDVRDRGVKHLLLSWTLGGYPSQNLVSAAKYYFEDVRVPAEDPDERRACELFSKAFREFPFDVVTLYRGPQNAGPSNPLYPEPTGYSSTMTCFSYDDIDTWRSVYPREVFRSQLEKLCGIWEQGLEIIRGYDSSTALMARATYCLFRSSLDQFDFVIAREKGDAAKAKELAKREEETARLMLDCMNKNAAVGFEAANQYYFTKRTLVEKIVNCRYIQAVL